MTSRGDKSREKYQTMKKIPEKKIYPTRFNGYYVGKDGTIWTHWTSDGYVGEIRRMNESPRGGADPDDRYLSINISLKNENGKTLKQIKYYSHKLVAETLIPNENAYPEVNHKNRNKLDNRVENLEWTTREKNMQHLSDTLSDIVIREKPLIEEYIPIIESVPENWKMFYKPEKIFTPPKPKYKIIDKLYSKEYQVRNVSNWVNTHWEQLSQRGRTKKSKTFYHNLMMARKNSKDYLGLEVVDI